LENNIKRIGFACKWIDRPDQVDGISAKDDAKQYNTGTTTVTWLNRQTRQVAEQKLWDLMHQNIQATYKLIERVSKLDEHLRMVRLSSDILPAYTHDNWISFWSSSDIQNTLEREFARLGNLAIENRVRLSFHPGQFVVLGSESDAIVQRSIAEVEYHTDMARFLGYGHSFHDHGFKINVHISGRRGPDGVRAAFSKLSKEARNLLTIENEEITHGLDNCLAISDICSIVLDLHHHWLHDAEYIQASDDRVKRVVDSWRGLRPTCHYSVSRESLLVGHDSNHRPDLGDLLAQGHKRQHLRAHSNFYWNSAVDAWALTFLDDFDIMCEAKGKNLASFELVEYAKQQGII